MNSCSPPSTALTPPASETLSTRALDTPARRRTAAMPTRLGVWLLAALALASVIALLLHVPQTQVTLAAGVGVGLWVVWVLLDVALNHWQPLPLTVHRQLPQALALGVPKVLSLTLANPSTRRLNVIVFDDLDPSLEFTGLPQQVSVPPASELTLHYTVTPRRRGLVQWLGAQVRAPGRLGAIELRSTLGEVQRLNVFPNFATVARYAWLAGDRRLSQIGIKAYPQRGMGTDFKQLSDYKVGDPIRHIDWKATFKHNRPIVREFQDERDQCVLFLLDCGRRMRADEGEQSLDGSHFDQALNALMLLTYVALKEGDEVGAMTFGTHASHQRHFAPRKGSASLNALMARLHDIQPDATHSDYLQVAQDVLRLQHKRALVIMLTNFRDEDATELQPALKLLRTRHLVMVASLRERVLSETLAQAMRQPSDALEVASAHWFEQSRRDAFRRVVGRDALSVDVEPRHLAVTLVNRYHAVKKSGLL